MSYNCFFVIWTLYSSVLFVQASINNSNCSTNSSTMSTSYAQCLDLEEPYLSCPDPSLCEVTNSGDNVGLAFGLTIGAGLSTTLGALFPFIPCVKRSNTLYLAAGLALAAGVMIYVSFTEIWTKAKWNFCCESPVHFDLLTTVCFFGGIIITLILDLLVSLLQKIDCGFSCCRKNRGETDDNKRRFSVTNPFRRSTNEKIPMESFSTSDSNEPSASLDENCSNQVNAHNYDAVSHEPSIGTCTSVLPSNGDQVGMETVSVSVQSNNVSENTNNFIGVSPQELLSESSLLRMRAVVPEMSGDSAIDVGGDEESSVSGGRSVSVDGGLVRRASYQEMVDQVHDDSVEPLGPEEFRAVTEGLGKDAKKLHRMGILTGLAIAIHNFPEGLATFVATLADPSLGIALCIAIAFHNIPEGVCVAMPVYYATGKRWKGFLWAFLSGISEPIGALLGWLVLKDVFGPLVYGIAFGLISGMMVFIALKELLPTARRFDTTNGHLVNGFLIAGMVIMAISLILFLY